MVVRARGLARHLLPAGRLAELARAGGVGVLAGLLESSGYAIGHTEGGAARSATDVIDAAIEREGARHLGILACWLGRRRALFAGVFEGEERRVLRIIVRRIAAGDTRGAPPAPAEQLPWLPRRAMRELGAATEWPSLVRALRRAGSAYAEPLDRALRQAGSAAPALEAALEDTFARRSREAAARAEGPLRSWVADGIDLENAWDVLLGAGGAHLEGGRRLGRARRDAIALEPDERVRWKELSRVFAVGALAAVFIDPQAPLASLERRALRARIVELRRAARREPLGPAPILEVVMRLRAEQVSLRCIAWGLGQGLPPAVIEGGLVWPP